MFFGIRQNICKKMNNVMGNINNNHLDEALKECEETLKMGGQILIKDDPLLLKCKNILAGIYIEKEDYIHAKLLIEELVKKYKKYYTEDSEEYAIGLHNFAMILHELGLDDDAEVNIQKCISIRKKILGDSDLDYIESENILSAIYIEKSEHKQAKELLEKIVMRCRGISECKDEQLARYLNSLGAVCFYLNEYDDAKKYLVEAINIFKKTNNINNRVYADCLITLGNIYYNLGKYIECEDSYKKAKQIYTDLSLCESLHYATCINELAKLYTEINKFNEAKEIYEESERIISQKLGNENERIASIYHNLAKIYILDRDKDFGDVIAEDYLNKSLDIRRKLLGSEHLNYIKNLIAISQLQIRNNNKKDAKKNLEAAEKFYRDKKYTNTQDYAICISELSLIYMNENNIQYAIRLQKQSCDIFKNILGKINFVYSTSLIRLAYVYYKEDLHKAYRLMHKAMNIENKIITQNLIFQTDETRNNILEKLNENYNSFLTFVTCEREILNRYNNQISNIILFRKGIFTQITYNCINVKRRYPNLKDKIEEVAKYKEEYFKSNFDEEIFRKNKELITELETKILKEIGRGGILSNIINIKFEDIYENLKDDQIIVDYIRIACDIDYYSNKYVAVVYSKNNISPKIITLENSDEVDKLVEEFIECVKSKKKPKKDKLEDIIIKPILSELDGKKNIIIIPDGEICKVPFGILSIDNGYLSDKYSIIYASSCRDIIVKNKNNKINCNESIVLADPNFNLSVDYKNKLDEVLDFRAFDRNYMLKTRAICEKLIFSKIEGQLIAKKLGVNAYIGNNVLKSCIMNIKSPKILHIATHGFFLENVKYSGDDDFNMYPRTTNLKKSSNPLIRSFIALAGAQTWFEGDEVLEEAGNGILTAEDIMNLNLENTQLVVLSACETGLGDIKNGEGVYGLRRAFHLVGAKNLVMSLWNVNDMATSILMNKFYEYIIEYGNMDKENIRYGLCLKNAQDFLKNLTVRELINTEVINEMKKKSADKDNFNELMDKYNNMDLEDKPFSHPYFWGGFIIQGL